MPFLPFVALQLREEAFEVIHDFDVIQSAVILRCCHTRATPTVSLITSC